MVPDSEDEFILAFLECRGTDYKLRRIEEVWAFDDWQIENTHDFIQWMFPLPLENTAQLSRPILSPVGAKKIAESSLALDSLTKSRSWYLNFLKKSSGWLQKYDHNHLRITRMLKSTALINGPAVAQENYTLVKNIAGKNFHSIGKVAVAFWENALKING